MLRENNFVSTDPLTEGEVYHGINLINEYKQASYGFFAIVCLGVAILIYIISSPTSNINTSDDIINYIADMVFKLGIIKNDDKDDDDDDDSVLPFYTPLDAVKNINNKTIAVDISDYTYKQINMNTIEDV
jgi:hypothetical protein